MLKINDYNYTIRIWGKPTGKELLRHLVLKNKLRIKVEAKKWDILGFGRQGRKDEKLE
jgi:hypothetical protein